MTFLHKRVSVFYSNELREMRADSHIPKKAGKVAWRGVDMGVWGWGREVRGLRWRVGWGVRWIHFHVKTCFVQEVQELKTKILNEGVFL